MACESLESRLNDVYRLLGPTHVVHLLDVVTLAIYMYTSTARRLNHHESLHV